MAGDRPTKRAQVIYYEQEAKTMQIHSSRCLDGAVVPVVASPGRNTGVERLVKASGLVTPQGRSRPRRAPAAPFPRSPGRRCRPRLHRPNPIGGPKIKHPPRCGANLRISRPPQRPCRDPEPPPDSPTTTHHQLRHDSDGALGGGLCMTGPC